MIRVLLFAFLASVCLAAETPTPTPKSTPKPTPTPAPTPKPSVQEMIDSLSEEDLEKATQTLKALFLDPARTDDKAAKRALLEGFIRRLSPGASIDKAGDATTAPAAEPFLAEILDGHIAYLRIGAITKDNLTQLDAALAGFAGKPVDAVILDLRGAPANADFETAAEFARRFCAKGRLLFSIQKPSAKQERIFTSNQDPAFQGIVVVLTDADTSGSAEALAATLRLNTDAMIIGAPTTGEAVEFTDLPLGGNTVLRIAVAQVILPEKGPIYPDGVKPDVTISLPRSVQEEIFRQSKKTGVSQFVYETERRRMNEASLVANENPEIDSAQSAQRDGNRPPQLRDTVLQRAVDLITAINFYRTKK